MIRKCPSKPVAFGSFLQQRSGVCGLEGAHVGWPRCTGRANTGSGGHRQVQHWRGAALQSPAMPGCGKLCRAVAMLLTHQLGWVGKRREGSFPTPALLPATIYRFFLIVISPVQIDCHQDIGKSVETQKGYALQQRLCGLLRSSPCHITFFSNSCPSPATSHEGKPCHTASHEHRLGTQAYG